MARVYGRKERKFVKTAIKVPGWTLAIKDRAVVGPAIATINILSQRVEDTLVQFRQAVNDLEVIKYDLDLFYAEAIHTHKK